MQGASNLVRRRVSGIYSVRLYVPRRLQEAVGKLEIVRSTGTRDFRLAKIAAAELTAHWHRALRQFDRMDVRKVKTGSIDLLGDGFISLDEAAQILGASPTALAQALDARHAPFFVQAQEWLGWKVEDIYEALDHAHDEFGLYEVVIDDAKLNRVGSRQRSSERLQIRFPEQAVQATTTGRAVRVCQFLLWPSADRAFVCDLPGQSVSAGALDVRRADVEAYRLSLLPLVTPEMLAVTQSASDVLDTSRTRAGKTFSELASAFLAHNGPSWKADNVVRKRDLCAAFSELMDDPPVHAIDRELVRDFAERIKLLPANRQRVRQRFQRPEAGYNELIELTKAHELVRLTANAQQRMLDNLSEVFVWGMKEDLMQKNPAAGLGGEALKAAGHVVLRAHEQRSAFSPLELERIFSARWFADGVGPRTRRGSFFAYRPHYYWLPLLALYAGGRLNELSQLYLKDVCVDANGVSYIDFNLEGRGKLDADEDDDGEESDTGSDKSLKTINSQRAVPVHARLLELGLLEWVDALREAGFDRLFPELLYNSVKGYGKAAGKWFNDSYLGKQLKVPRGTGKVFHSFRHNFATAMSQVDMPGPARADLMGHARVGSEGDRRYTKGMAASETKPHIDKLAYPLPTVGAFRVGEGLEAIADAMKLKRRKTR